MKDTRLHILQNTTGLSMAPLQCWDGNQHTEATMETRKQVTHIRVIQKDNPAIMETMITSNCRLDHFLET